MAGRERDRYGRRGWRERSADIPASIREHPRVTFAIVAMVVLWAITTLLRPTDAGIADLTAGECLYIRAGTGALGSVRSITGDFAELAGCDASHSHEVLLVASLDELGSPYPDVDTGLAETTAVCQEALTEATGGAADRAADPALTVTLLIPSPADWEAGLRAGACIVGRTDGTFLDRRVRELSGG